MKAASCFAAAALGLLALAAHGQDATDPVGHVRVVGVPFGSGVPVAGGLPPPTAAAHVAASEYHVPGYLPGHPTAATLWPRVVYVPCKRDAEGALLCAGYDVSPLRGEYVYLHPLVEPTRQPAAPEPKPTPRPAPPVPKKPMG